MWVRLGKVYGRLELEPVFGLMLTITVTINFRWGILGVTHSVKLKMVAYQNVTPVS